ncbi:hypothetical protein I6E84_04395 [Psychrobacter sp. SCQQ22]|uniref:DUF6708 domain-containing protein n=1 Tax=Psychrobacter sp. SCQQ22 TaxID=2792059 RepID=UPI0018CF4940|nr:DUF6708 domain-containing protein [Psychrobacter sp. SCQQ22]MBH0085455.1 hypothetical protein [Psychrobacter sp. SCQQ22]
MQLRDDFAQHISELNDPLERPYTASIDKSLLKNTEDIEHLNKEIHDVNPDYLTFLPAYFWYFYFIIAWTYFASFMFFIVSIGEVFRLEISNVPLFLLDIFILLLMFIVFCTPLILLIYQFFRKYSIRTQYYFLKKEQKIAYYYRPLMKFRQPYELKIVDYKDVHPDLHQDPYNRAYTPLNLYVADPETGDITHHLKLEDYRVNPRVQWAFIRTYMESPADELPIDAQFCEAYPADTSKSLFACADIVFRKNGILPSNHSGGDQIMVFIIGSIIALGNLFQANHYQCTKRAILHPEVIKLLTWDGQDNPYPIQPITDEAELAFEGRNWEVNVRWVCIILINAGLFAWAVVAYNA